MMHAEEQQDIRAGADAVPALQSHAPQLYVCMAAVGVGYRASPLILVFKDGTRHVND
jgi:hypothetical protein